MKVLTLNILPIQQGSVSFFLGKIKAYDLGRLSSSDIRKMVTKTDTTYIQGIQRELNEVKITSITEYLNTHDASFPNGVILGISGNSIISQNSTSITILDSEETFSIIDGQHRIEGLKRMPEEYQRNFDVIISIYKNLKISEQAYLFSTVNSEQTKVNPSLNYNLELESEINTPRKTVALIGRVFNESDDSPWHGKIDLFLQKEAQENEEDEDFTGAATLKLAGFIREIEGLIYEKREYYKIREALYENSNNVESLQRYQLKSSEKPLWHYYSESKLIELMELLTDFFQAFQNTFPNDWNDKKSILTKTTGYGAMMLLFKDLYCEGLTNYGQFIGRIEKLQGLDGTINSNIFASSGGQSKKRLYEEFKNIIDSEG